MHESLQPAQLTMDMTWTWTTPVSCARSDQRVIAEHTADVYRPVVRQRKALREIRDEQHVRRHRDRVALEIHIGIAVAIDAGLVVPVIRHADGLQVRELAIERATRRAGATASSASTTWRAARSPSRRSV
jgi:hypothetical protein